MSICLPVCLPVRFSVCLSACLFASEYFCLFACVSTYASVCAYFCVSVHVSVSLSLWMCLYSVGLYLCMCASIYLSHCLFLRLFVCVCEYHPSCSPICQSVSPS